MARNNISKMLQKKDPTTLRTPIKPVDILDAAATPKQEDTQEETTQKVERTEKESHETDSVKRSDKKYDKTVRNKRTENSNQINDRSKRERKSSIYSEQDIQSLLAARQRAKERYSFEIYTDQKEDIQRICELYETSTGKKLSASRLIREVLESFIPDALKAFDKSDT